MSDDTTILDISSGWRIEATDPVVSPVREGPHGHGLVARFFRRRRWRLEKPLEVHFAGVKIVVPAGFETDFASVPRCVQGLLCEDSIFSVAAIVHDYLYWRGAPKVLSDGFFFALMQWEGISRFDRLVMWQAVQWFGGSAYAGHRNREAAERAAALLHR